MTRLPINYKADWTPQACGKSVKYFTLIGAILGAIDALAAFLLFAFFEKTGIKPTPFIPAFCLLLVNICSTGALHCDGFIDTMDGLLSGRKKERMLEIMKDSRVGAHGVTALIMLILGKYTLLLTLCAAVISGSHGLYMLLDALFLMPLLGRLSMVIGTALFPYARKEGLGKAFAEYSDKKTLLCNFIIVLLLIPAFTSMHYGNAILALAATVIFSLLFCRYVTKKIGGMTGDVYGAVTELSELLVLFAFALTS